VSKLRKYKLGYLLIDLVFYYSSRTGTTIPERLKISGIEGKYKNINYYTLIG